MTQGPDTSHPHSVVVTMLDPTEPRPTRIRVAVRGLRWLALSLDPDKTEDRRLKLAGMLFARAIEHMAAGRGMGTVQSDIVDECRDVGLLPTERAMSAAMLYRRGVRAMGLAASEGVVHWVVVLGGGVRAYDRVRRRRWGTSLEELREALARLAVEYGT